MSAAELVERPQVVYTGEFDTYTRDEIELLATHAADAQDAAMYPVAAFTGLRQGELLALRWKASTGSPASSTSAATTPTAERRSQRASASAASR